MVQNQLLLGGIYQTTWDARPFRIIGYDEFSIFYDCQIDAPNWVFASNLKRKCHFYKVPTNLFTEKATLIDVAPLSKSEFEVFRPDLPIAFGRHKNLNWNSFEINEIDASINDLLKSSELILVPTGKKGGLNKGTKIVSQNNSFFKYIEILLAAKDLQLSINDTLKNGIGLHRLGIDKGIPSYYIGEFIDRANNLK